MFGVDSTALLVLSATVFLFLVRRSSYATRGVDEVI
jgi:hypothetical protein